MSRALGDMAVAVTEVESRTKAVRSAGMVKSKAKSREKQKSWGSKGRSRMPLRRAARGSGGRKCGAQEPGFEGTEDELVRETSRSRLGQRNSEDEAAWYEKGRI